LGRKSKSEKSSSNECLVDNKNINSNRDIDAYGSINYMDMKRSQSIIENYKTANFQNLNEKTLNFYEIFENQNFLINKYHCDFNLNPHELNFKHGMILSFIGDKLYQAYIETDLITEIQFNRMQKLILSNKSDNNLKPVGHDADLNEVCFGLTESARLIVRDLIKFSKMVPGLDRVTENDFKTIINEKLFYYALIKNSKLIVDGESYIFLPNNIQYSKPWFIKTIGNEMTDKMFDFYASFNDIKLTLKEISTLLPYIITLPGIIFKK
jgi:hypothetical protein